MQQFHPAKQNRMLNEALLSDLQRRLFVKKFLITAALAAIATVSPASAKDMSSFSHQGVTYKYSVTNISDSKRVISGFATSGSAFRLVVSGDRVSGTVNGMPVSFTVSEAKNAAASTAPVTVASR